MQCEFHVEKESRLCACALGSVKRSAYLISDHICKYFEIKLTDAHVPSEYLTAAHRSKAPESKPQDYGRNKDGGQSSNRDNRYRWDQESDDDQTMADDTSVSMQGTYTSLNRSSQVNTFCRAFLSRI